MEELLGYHLAFLPASLKTTDAYPILKYQSNSRSDQRPYFLGLGPHHPESDRTAPGEIYPLKASREIKLRFPWFSSFAQ